MTTETSEYYLISHGLYFRPKARGYTGIRDEAGLFSKSYAENYARHGDPVMVHKDDQKMAPEFMPSAYNDLVINHLKSQRDQAVAKLAAAEKMITAFMRHDHKNDNDGTAYPFWAIVSNGGIGNICWHSGPWFNRQDAEQHLKNKTHRYPKKAYVYCFSGHMSHHYTELYDAANKALAEYSKWKGE